MLKQTESEISISLFDSVRGVCHSRAVFELKKYRENAAFIGTGLVSGLVCCLYAMGFSAAEKLAQAFYGSHPDAIFFLAPVGLMLAMLVVRRLAPGAFGSGIPQVIGSLEQKEQGLFDKFLNLKTITVKIISSLLAVFSGAAIGREGPSLQVAAGIGHNMGRLFEKFGVKIRTDQLIIAGAASGLAAAFNTPIGGIVYAVEELASDHIRSYKTVLLMAVLVSGFTAQLILGNYLYLGYPQVLSSPTVYNLALASVLSFFAGIAGGLFSKSLLWLSSLRKSLNLRNQVFFVIGAGLLLAGAYLLFGERAIFSGKDSINYVLFENGPVRIDETLLRFFSPLISSCTGIAGGIFAPSLSAGAVMGGFVSDFFDPGMRTLLGLAGMVGFLTGVTHTPITSFVLVLEMSDRHGAVFPMMLAALFSSLGTKLIAKKSFYESVAEELKPQKPEPPAPAHAP